MEHGPWDVGESHWRTDKWNLRRDYFVIWLLQEWAITYISLLLVCSLTFSMLQFTLCVSAAHKASQSFFSNRAVLFNKIHSSTRYRLFIREVIFPKPNSVYSLAKTFCLHSVHICLVLAERDVAFVSFPVTALVEKENNHGIILCCWCECHAQITGR